MPIIYGLYAPNAPNLIAPSVFGGAGASTAEDLRRLDLPERVRPETIVVVSPHWASRAEFLVHGGVRPPQIYDFSGFPSELYDARYQPAGDPALAQAIVRNAAVRGIAARTTEEWGIDHGAWAPLLHVAPGARIPVVPTGIRTGHPGEHVEFGRSIAEAASDLGRRVAIVGTGSITHRLDRMDLSGGTMWEEGEAIEREVTDLALSRQVDALLKFDRRKWEAVAPEGGLNPLFVVLGALGGDWNGRLVSTGQVFGAAGMSVLEYTPATPRDPVAGA